MPRDKEGLNEIFAFVKGDVESLEGDAVSIEVKDSNRPDIWSVEGVARALKGYLGVGRIRPITIAGRSNLSVVVDKRVKPIRPFISTAIVKGLQPTDEALKSWINLQEKLDQTYGRKRKRASIGFYQSDLIQSPLSYTVANPDIITFAPLGSEEKQTLREIMETHGSPRRLLSPNLSPTRASLRLSYVNTLLGASLTLKEASRFAERAGYRVRRATGDTIELDIPSYRTDIMHSVDIIEDIAIAMDINKLKPEWPRIWTVGNLAKETDETESMAEIMIGLGFQEVLTYALTSPVVDADNMHSNKGLVVELLNPRMTTHTTLRSWLLPSLLEILSHNTHVDYPQKIFEVGKSIKRGESQMQPIEETRKLAAVTIHAGAGFTEIRSSLDALSENIGRTFEIRSTEHPSFLSGRCGAIISDGREVGVVGEVSPLVIKSWGLNLPAAAFEMELQ